MAEMKTKPKRKWLSLKTQLIVVGAVGAVAWMSRFLWRRAKNNVS